MIETINLQKQSVNLLLSALGKKEYQRIVSQLEQVDLMFGDVLFNPGDKINHVYFPQTAVISFLASEDEAVIEIGLIGNEGMVGLPLFLGVFDSRILITVQGNGTALRMRAKDFLKECEQNERLSRVMRRYTHYLLMQVSQSVICNRRHLIEDRLACVLLIMHDRMITTQFKLKQEFLSMILGVRREAITIAAGSLQKKQLISYSRGNLLILDRKGLEAVCCRCYENLTREYQEFVAAENRLN
jgi:CRP-like cAMP-binding protein